MSSSKKCVFGCSDLDASTHRFPHPERRKELFEKWIGIVGEKLKVIDPIRIYKNKFVCDYHFPPEHKVTGHRLINFAVPTLYLNGIHSSAGISVQQEHNYCLPRMWKNENQPNAHFANTLNQKSPDKVLRECLETNKHIQPSTLQSTFKALPETELFSWQKNEEQLLEEDLEKETIDEADAVEAFLAVVDTPSGYHCNICLAEIIGFRYVCVQCLDWDLCGACEARGAHPHHYVLRIPAQRPRDEVRATLRTIRRVLADAIVHVDEPNTHIVPVIKTEADYCENDPIKVDPSSEMADYTTLPHPKHKQLELYTGPDEDFLYSDEDSDTNSAKSISEIAESDIESPSPSGTGVADGQKFKFIEKKLFRSVKKPIRPISSSSRMLVKQAVVVLERLTVEAGAPEHKRRRLADNHSPPPP